MIGGKLAPHTLVMSAYVSAHCFTLKGCSCPYCINLAFVSPCSRKCIYHPPVLEGVAALQYTYPLMAGSGPWVARAAVLQCPADWFNSCYALSAGGPLHAMYTVATVITVFAAQVHVAI